MNGSCLHTRVLHIELVEAYIVHYLHASYITQVVDYKLTYLSLIPGRVKTVQLN